MDPYDSLSLCKSDQVLSLAGRDDCQQIIEAMSQQARHSLYIFTDKLETRLYDTIEFTDSVRRIIAGNPNARIRILVHSLDKLVQQSHRLLELSRRLSTHIGIRELSRPYNHAFFVADRCGVVDRRVADRYEGTASFNNPGRASELIAFFDSIWDLSAQNLELQSLKV